MRDLILEDATIERVFKEHSGKAIQHASLRLRYQKHLSLLIPIQNWKSRKIPEIKSEVVK